MPPPADGFRAQERIIPGKKFLPVGLVRRGFDQGKSGQKISGIVFRQTRIEQIGPERSGQRRNLGPEFTGQ